MSDDKFTELAQFELDPDSVRMLPKPFCLRHDVVVLGEFDREEDQSVTVGMLDPSDGDLKLQIADLIQHPIDGVQLNQYEIDKAIREGFGSGGYSQRDAIVIPDRSDQENPKTAKTMVEQIISRAVKQGASDIHIETFKDDVDLRFRIDGILHQMYTNLSPRNVDEVVNRIKILAELDITEQRRPQDGRIQCEMTLPERGETDIDFRISIVPAPAGEDVVIRILDSEAGLMPVTDLGMKPEMEETFLQMLQNPEGLILVTGPTGSGKTTTLYASLLEINDGRRKIITAEDPIEYDIDKICQKEVSEQMPLPLLLRALLRQDPDVMLVGEIRDEITGETALAASNTGHVVFGTVHTPDAIGTLTRLRGLGLDNSEMADALLGVVSQRLVRCVCSECGESVEATDEQRSLFGPKVDDLDLRKGTGCSECHHTGYDGREGIFELLVIDREIQEMISDGVSATDLREYVRDRGHRDLLDDAYQKVDDGETTLDELSRVVPFRQILSRRQND